MVFHIDEVSGPCKTSNTTTKSTFSFLSLLAKANDQFLRQTIKDQSGIYAGSGWVDAVLDQRETGLRDVDLSIVSELISIFIRLHDLRDPRGSESAVQKFVPSTPGDNQSNTFLESENIQFLANTELSSYLQAFRIIYVHRAYKSKELWFWTYR